MRQRLVICLTFALLITSGCASNRQSNSSTNELTPLSSNQIQPVKDCVYFQELAYSIQSESKSEHTKLITDDLINQWTYVIMNHSKCFTQEEFCEALINHNSVSPAGRQEVSLDC